MSETIVGLAVLGLPLILAGYIVLRQSKHVLWFYLALLAVGLGYLVTTGTTADIGHFAVTMVRGSDSSPVPAQ